VIRTGYVCSFFFWMDLVSTFSTVLDVPWAMELLGLGVLSG
jgi:hypothetical protein